MNEAKQPTSIQLPEPDAENVVQLQGKTMPVTTFKASPFPVKFKPRTQDLTLGRIVQLGVRNPHRILDYWISQRQTNYTPPRDKVGLGLEQKLHEPNTRPTAHDYHAKKKLIRVASTVKRRTYNRKDENGRRKYKKI